MNICVFLGASNGLLPIYTDATQELAIEIVKNNATLVYGGSNVGLMGKIADFILSYEKKVIGVVPLLGLPEEVTHAHLSELIHTADVENRKKIMMEISDVFIALPGGIGTFEEIFRVWSAIKLNELRKPLIIININNYYDPLIKMIKNSVAEKFIKYEHMELLNIVKNVSCAFDKIYQRKET